MRQLRLARDYTLYTTKMAQLGLTISKGSVDGEAPREDTVRSNKWIIIVITVLRLRAGLLPHLLCHRCW